ncbi:DUF3987 domain-containing protein [Botrimarina mediterranea]|uniref:DUF3987 domain-containing protein n=1 Tax=Botrimarina mediterranea TaxID=2528022 RepID=A0A518K3U8_9BACT|nr:DUF3987 domain-containing protein [Botrimarina mediterranea]QDV72483.1 hypothetical protein Spa11_06610 [Botrimarina mediterranea]
MSISDGAAWREVSKQEICPVCERPDWCAVTGPEGNPDAAYCMRESSDLPKGDGWIHRLKDHGLEATPRRKLPTSKVQSTAKAPLKAKPSDNGDEPKDAAVYPTAEASVASYAQQLGKPDRQWPYRDADGETVLVVARWDATGERKKTIRPVSRTAGGWIKAQAPAGRPLYRLPELLASEGTVYVTEGEPAADALVALGLTATTSSTGSTAAVKSDWSPLAGRDVVIVPDNDEPGAKYRDAVLALLGRLSNRPMARVVELPGLPAKGDAVDWLAAGHTADELARVVEATEPAELPTPERPLVYRPFPTHTLPPTMARFVTEAARAVGCDEAIVAMPALAVAAGAIGATRTLRLKRTWYEPAVLWCVVVSPSGAMKSQGRKLVLAPILRRQKKELAAHREALRAFGPLQAIYEKDLAAWKKSKSSEPPPEAPEAPQLRELLLSDTTVEAVAKALYANPRGVLLDRDELAAWFGSFDAYKSGKGSDAQNWMNTHGAGYVKVNRSSAAGAPLFVERACVSVCGTIQPSIFTRALSGEHRESGFAARLLVANPPRRAKRWTDDEVSETTEAAFTSGLLALLDLEFGADDSEEGEGDPIPRVLRLSPVAQRRFVAFVNHHGAAGLERDGDEAAAWSKLEGYAARLALVFALFEDPDAVEVSDDQLARAITLVEWFAHEAARFYRGARETDDERRLRELADWIDTKHGGAISPRKLAQGRRDLKTVEKAEAAIAELIGAGYGEWRIKRTATKSGREFVLASFAASAPSTSTDSTKSPAPRESVDVDAPLVAEIEPAPPFEPAGEPPPLPAEGVGDADDWEAA